MRLLYRHPVEPTSSAAVVYDAHISKEEIKAKRRSFHGGAWQGGAGL